MTTEEILLTVLTVCIVVLIIIVVAVLVVILQILKRFRKITAEVQNIAERGTIAAERIAPFGAAAVSILQAIKVVTKKRR